MISSILNLSDEEKKRLICTVLPALDKDWLAHQEKCKRGGLLLEAYRELTGLSQTELVDKLPTHQNSQSRHRGQLVSLHEKGIRKIRDADIGALVNLFSNQFMFDEAYFRKTIQQSNEAIKMKGAMKRAHSISLGNIQPSSVAPELIIEPKAGEREL